MPTKLPFDEFNSYDYKYSDKVMESLLRHTIRQFANAKAHCHRFFVSRNCAEYAKNLYSKNWRETKKALLKIGKHYWTECDDEWLYLYLTDYDPVYRVVYENEADRKRALFLEAVMSADNITGKQAEIDRAMRSWIRMITQLGIGVADSSAMEAIKAAGFDKVMWIAEHDERVCHDCVELDKKVFPIDNVPDKPHIRCRCRLRAAR